MGWTCGRCNGENTDFDKVCVHCKAAETPFYRKGQREDKASGVLAIRLNDQERALLEDIKQVLDLSSDGAALKQAAFVGWDVLQRTLGRENLRWLASKDRQSRGPK